MSMCPIQTSTLVKQDIIGTKMYFLQNNINTYVRIIYFAINETHIKNF